MDSSAKSTELSTQQENEYAPRFRVYRRRQILRNDVRREREKIFLFGDNLEQTGYLGQASQMRDEPNAIGIPTKKAPSMDVDAFFTDDEYEENTAAIDKALNQLYDYDVGTQVVIPMAGLGTGFAQLPRRAPKTYLYLKQKLDDLANAHENKNC